MDKKIILTLKQEKELMHYLFHLANIGFPFTPKELQVSIPVLC